jgi:MSHA biogenesis protein MshQ
VGWTLVRRIDNTAGNGNSLAIYYKLAGATEGTSYRWTLTSSTGAAGGITAFSGVDPVNPIDVEAGQITPNGLSLAAPSITTRFAGDMIVTSHALSSSTTFTPPAGMAEALEIASETVPASGGESIEVNYAPQAATGATGTRAATAAGNADTGNAHTLALRPR